MDAIPKTVLRQNARGVGAFRMEVPESLDNPSGVPPHGEEDIHKNCLTLKPVPQINVCDFMKIHLKADYAM